VKGRKEHAEKVGLARYRGDRELRAGGGEREEEAGVVVVFSL
jgi:hypothetical protein